MDTQENHVLVVMSTGSRRFGVPLASVEGVVALVDLLPLPQASGALAGLVNVRGTIAPVIDLGLRFDMRQTRRDLSTKLVAVRTAIRLLLLLCDEVEGVVRLPVEQVSSLRSLLPGSAALPSVATLSDGLIYIYDPDHLLHDAEERSLALALRGSAG